MPVDQAVVQYSPKDNSRIVSVDFEENLGNLPSTDEATLLVPCHLWFTDDHINDPKVAITHRGGTPDSDNTYEVSANYFGTVGGTNDHIELNYDTEYRDRWLGFSGNYNVQALAREDGNTTTRLGDAMDPGYESAKSLDFMAEAQYEEPFNLPNVDKSTNTIILRWVETRDGWHRPGKILEQDGSQQGEYTQIQQFVDSWNRFWIRFGIEK